MSRPLVSVIVPAFNAAQQLRESLDSACAQTCSEIELVLVDDGSTDDTLEIARSFAPRLRVLEQPRQGPGAARNAGILSTHAPYIAFLDADDLWDPSKLARQVAALEALPEAGLCCTDFSLSAEPETNRESRYARFDAIDGDDAFHRLLHANFLATSAVMLRRSTLAETGLFDGTLRGSEDLDLWLRMAHRRPFAMVREVLTWVREHSGRTSRTLAYQHDQLRATRMMLARWGHDARARRLLQRRLRTVLWNVAYAEKLRGESAAARKAYWQCALAGARPIGALARAAALYVLPVAATATPEQLLAASAL